MAVDLRDQGYPRNDHTPKDEPASDRLVGIYTRLGINQEFDISFVGRPNEATSAQWECFPWAAVRLHRPYSQSQFLPIIFKAEAGCAVATPGSRGFDVSPECSHMNLVTVIWSMIASACLTLAAMHLLVWFRKRTAWANLLFALTAVATAGMAACEVGTMHAQTPEEFGLFLRWFHVPGWLMIVTLVGFVRLYQRAGRPWLAWTVCGLRTVTLILDFVFTPNVNFRQITALRQISFLGTSISVAEGVPNPWMLIGHASLLLLVVFAIDATVTVWRRGERRQATLVGGSIIFFVTAGTLQMVLGMWEIVHMPLTPSLLFMGIVVAMGLELSEGVLRASELSDEVHETEARMALAAEAAGVGIWIWNIALNEVWGSERWMRMFGFASDADVTFENVMQRIHPEDRETVEREIGRALAERVDYAGEYRVVLPDSTQRWLTALGRVHPEANGSGGRMLGATLDITGRKASELEIAHQRNELAHLSRVTMLGELSGSLAHELNQPLTAILSNAQAAQRFMAREHVDLDEVRSILADIVAADQRAGEVIRRLRSLLKKEEVHHQPLSVNDVVQEVLKLMRSELMNRGVIVHVEVAKNLPQVQGDRIELQQVLLNLVINACDAMAERSAGTRRLRICTELVDTASIHLSVADRGVGIPPDMLEQVFTPFYTTKVHGMGLGLAVCRTIISAHGGKLWAQSQPNHGATFHLTLPVDARSAEQREDKHE